MSRSTDRKQLCGPAQARARLGQAELYLEVARMVLDEEAPEWPTVATGNAVLAAIAAADAICCATIGERYRGSDHRKAADLLEKATGDRRLAGLLRDVVDLKDAGHYGIANVLRSRAQAAVRKAGQLVDAARDRVPR